MQEKLNFTAMGSALVANIRAYHRDKGRGGVAGRILRKYRLLRHLCLSILTASDIDPNVAIGEGVMLPHPNGVIFHGRAVIGDHCMIMQQVTVGQLSEEEAPVIGSHVYIGAGAKILGKVVVGDGARIGANAVVLSDVPAKSTAVGIPAKIIEPK